MYQNWIKYNTETPPKRPQTSTGKERDSETGFSYFGARYYDSDVLTGWLSVDPMADKYPNISPYAYCAWTPVKLVDPDGEEVFIIFNKETNKLYLMDLDYYKKGLPTKHVSAKNYQLNGIRDKNGELTHNQVLVINNVFSGGKIENGNIVRDPDDNRQNPLPNATYDIVDNNADTKHEGWFRLDIQDDNRYNDKDDNTDRNGFRFHLGKLSWGCVTIDATQDEAQNIWNVVSSILNSTTSTKVSERRGRQWLNPFSNLTRYGSMKVIGNDLIPYKK